MKLYFKNVAVGVLSMLALSASAQNLEQQIQTYFEKEAAQLGLSKKDVSDWTVHNQHSSAQFDLTYAYVHQQYEGIEIHNAIANFVWNGEHLMMTGNRFEKDIAKQVNTTAPKIDEKEAILFAAQHLGVISESVDDIAKTKNANNQIVYTSASISTEEIPVNLCFTKVNNDLKLAWNLSIRPGNGEHWWSVRIDAVTGELLNQNDWVVNCTFGDDCTAHDHTTLQETPAPEQLLMMPPPPSTDQYNVFAIPVESPNHGSRSLEVGPSYPAASPYGWHDDDGTPGAEYTITRGNNVYASEDTGDNDTPGYSPDGGPSLNFDFPLNLNQPGTGYWDPAITNLFYMNNIMHDVFYNYGFDEAAGNFQENNYGNGASGSDYVRADAQDGSGTNNANFGTPPDGSNPRMQMYMWLTGGSQQSLQVNSGPLAGTYIGVHANIGTPVPFTPITSDLVLFDDQTGDFYDACENATNGASLSGKLVVIRRGGGCTYVDKIVRAESEGAIGVIVVNNVGGAPVVMGGTDPGIGIPAIMVIMSEGEAIISELENGGTVNASLGDFGPFDKDSDFDNGIIAHEYGHGISNRLTAGGNNTDCLYNEDQMGEGWSDWFSLILTIEAGDSGPTARGIGTYASGEAPNGGGIRPAPYSTDWTVNNYTYGITNNTQSISQPHGIGFIWCTMLWDLTWALIDQYGYDSDVYAGNGGNNIAMHLIMNGMKMQPCSPGFVDGRDAILQADELLYNGIHKCLIWEVFANRGLGYSADQGSTNDRTDQVQAFDLPPEIDHITNATVYCTDYVWPVNGQTYSASGTYYASVTPNSGCDSVATLNLTVNNTINSIVSYVNPVTLQCNVNNVNYQWLNCAGDDTAVPGATDQTFSPTENGLYAVIATQGTCVDTSVCMFVNQVDLDEFSPVNAFTVFPNPTKGTLSIDFGTEYTSVEIRVLNALGQQMATQHVEHASGHEFTLNGAPGVYFIEVSADGILNNRVKVVKE